MTDIAFKASIGTASKGEFVTAAHRKKDVLEFRRTHFIMGKHPTTHYSQSQFTTRLREGLTGGKQHQTISAAQTCGSNFKIGTGRNRFQYATTYNTITGQAPLHTAERARMDDVPAKRTHIMLGKAYRASYVTTHNKCFSHKGKSIQAIDKNFVYNIKTNHFEYGDTTPQTFQQLKQHYTSQSNLMYNNKGNPNTVRSVLDQAKKDDLRANHFTIGGNSANSRGTTMNS